MVSAGVETDPSSSGGLTVYVDESGNSGDAATAPDPRQDQQPVFALVGLGEVSGSGTLASLAGDLRRRHKIKSVEIKARAMDRRPDLIPSLLQELNERRIPVFVELMDKRYFVATNLVTYALGKGWLDVSSPHVIALANAFADLLTEHIGEQVLTSYGQFAVARNGEAFATFVECCRVEFAAAKLKMETQNRGGFELVEMMEAALEGALEMAGNAASYEDFLPSPDQDARGRHLPMLPQVPALTNMYARINRFTRRTPAVLVVHDEQAQFGPLLKGYASVLEANRYFTELAKSAVGQHVDWDFSGKRFALTFATSDTQPGIQLADVLARFLGRQLSAIITNEAADPELGRVAPLLRSLSAATRGNGINVVSTTKRADCFHGA